MKWYTDRAEEWERTKPVYSVCGDDCAVCPRYQAKTEEELHATAVFWRKAGWRDRVVSNDEIRCGGCGSRGKCVFMILPCVRRHGVSACRACPEYPCEKTADLLRRSAEKERQCRAACESETEFALLRRAFYEKEKNLETGLCALPAGTDAETPPESSFIRADSAREREPRP